MPLSLLVSIQRRAVQKGLEEELGEEQLGALGLFSVETEGSPHPNPQHPQEGQCRGSSNLCSL